MSTLRPDLQTIAELVTPNSRVLDIGCGEAELLAWLKSQKSVDGRGIEIEQERVQRAVRMGIPVIQGNVDTDLADYPTGAYDFAILSMTLQAMNNPKNVLAELTRIGKQAIVSVPNFGHWKNRLYLALHGKMPVTRTLAYEWYDTPNIHFCTIADFVILCERMGITIERRIMVDAQGQRSRFYGRGWWANLFGQQGVFLLSAR
ncbi:MAG: methionine biosynthesis protein MetW [Alphaproteobacteria bacterium]|nr:methionine biosynthesis protein MetW [Alphaproteobacteria bacterium]